MPKRSSTASRSEPQRPDFPTVSSDMAQRAAKSVTVPEPIISEWFEQFKAKHEAGLFNAVAKAYDFAVNKVRPAIAADEKNMSTILSQRQQVNHILETPIGQSLPDCQPQELLFCRVCGSGEKAPKRWKPLPGVSRSSHSEIIKGKGNFKCGKCTAPEEPVRRKTAQKRTEKPIVVVTQK